MCENSWPLRDFTCPGRPEREEENMRVNGMEQLTEDCVCCQCRVLSELDCGLSIAVEVFVFIGHEASLAKLASRS